MPPTTPIKDFPRVGVVVARLIVAGEDRGIRPFVVWLNDGKTMCEGITSMYVCRYSEMMDRMDPFMRLISVVESSRTGQVPNRLTIRLPALTMSAYPGLLCSDLSKGPKTCEITSFQLLGVLL